MSHHSSDIESKGDEVVFADAPAELSQAKAELATLEYTEEEERAIVRKFDWHVSGRRSLSQASKLMLKIIPLIWGGYIFNSLDRSNISNAKSDGMLSESQRPLPLI